MSNVSDRDLLQEYGRTKTEDAFEELVHRHVDLVYSTAFRVLRNATFAEDVTQRVFLALAQHASKLQHRAVLTGWLYETARNFAVTLVRGEERRRLREKDAAAMSNLDSNDSAEEWDRVSLHLDEALEQLNKTDRDAIVLRYFGRKTAREIEEQLGLNEAAQKRATRALEQVRLLLGTRGVQVPTKSLATLLSIQAVQSAPVGLAASVIGFAGTAKSLVSSTSAFNLIMASTKMKLGLAAALLVGVAPHWRFSIKLTWAYEMN